MLNGQALRMTLCQQRYLQKRLRRQFSMYHDLVQLSIEMAVALERGGQSKPLLQRWHRLIAPLLE